MEYPSKLIEEAVEAISTLPGIGKKTALRLVLHLLKEDEYASIRVAEAITQMRKNTSYCKTCHNISDSELCRICSSTRRDKSIICIVEDTRDVMAVENTSQYTGLYHVLGGVISPLDGIGPEKLKIDQLLNRIKSAEEPVKEVILALSATMEGDTTSFYLSKKISELGEIRVSTIARGIPVGGELEYADEITLGRSILSRTHYNSA